MNVDVLKSFKNELPEHVSLVAVSKTKPISDIQLAYDAGHRVFGENRAFELEEKYAQLPNDISWHMVGHLQRNKVKSIAPFVDFIQSADSPRIIKEINKEARKNDRTINILLQIKIAAEDSKYGWDFKELTEYIESGPLSNYHNIQVSGVMGMATFTDDTEQVRSEFKKLKRYYDRLKSLYFSANKFKDISMGMSGDYKIAIEEGSNMIRIGSILFGERV